MKKLLVTGLLISSVLANDPISALCAVELETALEKIEEAKVFLNSSTTLDEAKALYGPQAYQYFDALKALSDANLAYGKAVVEMCKGVKK